MLLAAGVRLGPYEVGELQGAGGMAEVYRTHDSRLGRDVAVRALSFRGAPVLPCDEESAGRPEVSP